MYMERPTNLKKEGFDFFSQASSVAGSLRIFMPVHWTSVILIGPVQTQGKFILNF